MHCDAGTHLFASMSSSWSAAAGLCRLLLTLARAGCPGLVGHRCLLPVPAATCTAPSQDNPVLHFGDVTRCSCGSPASCVVMEVLFKGLLLASAAGHGKPPVADSCRHHHTFGSIGIAGSCVCNMFHYCVDSAAQQLLVGMGKSLYCTSILVFGCSTNRRMCCLRTCGFEVVCAAR